MNWRVQIIIDGNAEITWGNAHQWVKLKHIYDLHAVSYDECDFFQILQRFLFIMIRRDEYI